MSKQTEKKRIVIVGGGFGGVYTYLNLQEALRSFENRPEITLISRDNYFLFTPLLHEVATGGVRASDIVQPLRDIVDTRVDRVLVATAKKIDAARRVVRTAGGDVPYDCLVLATGAASKFFNFPPAAVYGLKTMEDALRLKNRILEIFEAADRAAGDERKKLLTFVVIGGGSTGVELAAEMDEFVYDSLVKAYPTIAASEVKIFLVHAQRELVNGFAPSVRKKTLEVLKAEHMITVVLNSRVTTVSDGDVVLSDGTRFKSATVVVAAGVQATYPGIFRGHRA